MSDPSVPRSGRAQRRKSGPRRSSASRRGGDVVQPEPLQHQAQSTHEEARMVLPGIQALFGFQLIAVFNRPFFDLEIGDRVLHLAALVLVALAVGLIMAPASYRRLAESTRISRRWIRFASRCIAWAMAALMAAVSLDVYIVATMVVGSAPVAVLLGACSAAFLTWLWFVMPLSGGKRERTPNA